MGAFKPLLPFGGRTVAEACVESLREGGAGEVVVVVGHRAEELRERLGRYEFVRFASNEEAGSEMGASIARGVERVSEKAGAILVALVDQPAVPASVVRELIEARGREGARVVVPVWEGRGGHPVLVGAELRGELTRLDAGEGLRGLLRARGPEVLRLPVGSPYVRRDMDTWEDYVALHREVFGVGPEDARG
jgi:molybdenum cofactor cytidylyltransferase